jgi:hypothetical protein
MMAKLSRRDYALCYLFSVWFYTWLFDCVRSCLPRNATMRSLSYPAIVFFLLLLLICISQKLRADVGFAKKPIDILTRNIVVLVIDTGVDSHHEAFYGRTIVCPHSDDCADFWGHGTHVTSLILNGEMKHKKPTNKVCDRVLYILAIISREQAMKLHFVNV